MKEMDRREKLRDIVFSKWPWLFWATNGADRKLDNSMFAIVLASLGVVGILDAFPINSPMYFVAKGVAIFGLGAIFLVAASLLSPLARRWEGLLNRRGVSPAGHRAFRLYVFVLSVEIGVMALLGYLAYLENSQYPPKTIEHATPPQPAIKSSRLGCSQESNSFFTDQANALKVNIITNHHQNQEPQPLVGGSSIDTSKDAWLSIAKHIAANTKSVAKKAARENNFILSLLFGDRGYLSGACFSMDKIMIEERKI